MGNNSSSNNTIRDDPERGAQHNGGDKMNFNDPRSPSKGVSRTPLRITELNQQQSIDPRSPSGCVQRTPIQISQLKVHSTTAGKMDSTPPERLALNYENKLPKQDDKITQ